MSKKTSTSYHRDGTYTKTTTERDKTGHGRSYSTTYKPPSTVIGWTKVIGTSKTKF